MGTATVVRGVERNPDRGRRPAAAGRRPGRPALGRPQHARAARVPHRTRLRRSPLSERGARHDPDTDDDHAAWLDRVRRQSAVVDPRPRPPRPGRDGGPARALGRAMTVEQVDALYDRTLGHPLFTAQLAVTGDAAATSAALPDLFDVRLRDLADHPWRIARALGLADRALPVDVLEAVTDLRDVELTEGLRVLAHRHLLDPADTTARLAHPLVAEGVRRRLVPGEAVAGHARLARALADRSDASPAEVAAHYRAADDPAHEFPWRLGPRRRPSGGTRPRWSQSTGCARWTSGPPCPSAHTGVTRAGAKLAAVNALDSAGREPAGLALAEAALASGEAMSRDERFELAFRAAGITWGQHGPDRALGAPRRGPGHLRGRPLARPARQGPPSPLRVVVEVGPQRGCARPAGDRCRYLRPRRRPRHPGAALRDPWVAPRVQRRPHLSGGVVRTSRGRRA